MGSGMTRFLKVDQEPRVLASVFVSECECVWCQLLQLSDSSELSCLSESLTYLTYLTYLTLIQSQLSLGSRSENRSVMQSQQAYCGECAQITERQADDDMFDDDSISAGGPPKRQELDR